MKKKSLCEVLGPVLGMACAATASAQTPQQRATLPVPKGVRPTYTGRKIESLTFNGPAIAAVFRW